MPEAAKRRRRSADDAPEDAPDTATGTVEESGESTRDTSTDAGAPARDNGDSQSHEEGPTTLASELRDAIREAAVEVLRPVARNATKTAAKAAVTKGPDFVKDKVGPMVSDAGGAGEFLKSTLSKGGGAAGGLAGKLASGPAAPLVGKLTGDKGGKKPSGHGRGRRLPVQEYVDVAVPIDVAYDQWTQFAEFPKFMHRVERVEQRDDTTLMWHENIWGVRRSWEVEIVEQEPCERLVWQSSDGPETVGVVTFHRLSDRLTRVYVNLDFQPHGLFEKTASGFRMSRRALKSDLMRFKAFIEMRDEPTGAWRGVIEDGEVSEPDEGGGDERRNGRRADEPEDRDEEPVSEADDDEDLDEDDEEEDERPARSKRRRRAKSTSGRS